MCRGGKKVERCCSGAAAQQWLMGSAVCAPGVTEGHVWDEERSHGSDPQHLPDGGLQVGQPASVAELGGPVRTHLPVQLLLNPPLDLNSTHELSEKARLAKHGRGLNGLESNHVAARKYM